MAERAGQQSITSLPWWGRVCRAGWKVVRFFWGAIVVAMVPSAIVAMVFLSQKTSLQSLYLWPVLDWMQHHLLLIGLIMLVLIGLTGLLWLGSRERTTTTQGTPSEQNRTHMLRRLRLRYEQMRTQSLQGAVQMELGLASRPTAVQNLVSMSLRLPDQQEQLLSSQTSIVDAYKWAQQELLILGEPGAGKSTLLLDLAYHLVEQSEQDATQPLPVLLPLSSWATNRRPLQDWLSEQFALLYDAPRNLSQHWVQKEQLRFLLDGLDEMEASARTACIAAINIYHREHLQPLVVCSRTNEYDVSSTQERLALHAAVVVQPLSLKWADAYLKNLGKPLAALRAALEKNAVLAELATTPLMLQVLILAYLGTRAFPKGSPITAADLDRLRATDGRTQRRRGALSPPCHSCLAQLAGSRDEGAQPDHLLLEVLVSDWLPKRRRTIYEWSVVLLVGLAFGLVVGLGGGFSLLDYRALFPTEGIRRSVRNVLVLGLLVGLVVGPSIGLVVELGVGPGIIGLIVGLGIGQTNGLLVGLPWGRSAVQGDRTLFPNEGIRHYVRNGLFWGLGFGLFFGLLFGMYGNLLFGLVVGLLYGLVFGLAVVVQDYTLRFWLARSGFFPWRAVPFLEDATARILLRRIGGQYSFIHRLLLDYFADLDTQASPTPTAGPFT